jgi:hypothetical protein
MSSTKHTTSAFILFNFLVLLLTACSTTVGKSIKVSDAQLAQYDAMSKPKALGLLEGEISKARSANMAFLAPHYFNEANELFADLQAMPESTPKNVWVADIAKAHTLLDKGETISAQVRERFPRELELKGLLDQFNASESYPEEYKETIGTFSGLIEKVELGKAGNLDKDKNELIKAMQALDIKAVQYSALHESDLTNQATQHKIEAIKLAPIVFGEAERVYADATKRIAATPHNVDLVKHASEEALFMAHRAWFITERILALQKLSLEGIALEEEKYFSDLTTAIGQKDLRDQALFKQEEIIASTTKATLQDKTQLSTTSQSTSQSLEKRLKESDAALQQCSALTASLANQVEVRDLQIKVLREKAIQAETRIAP